MSCPSPADRRQCVRASSNHDNPSVSRTCADSERTEIFLAKSTPVEIGRANNSFGVMASTAGRPIDLSRLLSVPVGRRRDVADFVRIRNMRSENRQWVPTWWPVASSGCRVTTSCSPRPSSIGMTTPVPESPRGLGANRLEQRVHRVLVSPVDSVEFGVDGVRVSTHVFNTESEAGRLLAGLPDAWSAR